MPISTNVPRVNFAAARTQVEAALRANVVPLLIGDPGVGKTALLEQVALGLERACETLIGSTLDPTDVGGLPVVRVKGKGLDRVPLDLIQRCCDEPRVLFIDELASAPGPVQAALLRVILNRVAGDRTLHEETRIVAATNPEEQTPAGAPLSAPLVGRVMMVHLRPDEREVIDWFLHLGEEGSRLRDEAQDFALTCGAMPDLLEIDIPQGAVVGNEPWGAPRAWERAVRMRAALEGAGEDALHIGTAANVGEQRAIAYRGVMRMRKELPTVEEIIDDPAGARLPKKPEQAVAAIGLLPRVASANTWAAWVYCARLPPEVQTACGKHLQGRKDSPTSAKHVREGVKARVEVAALMKSGF